MDTGFLMGEETQGHGTVEGAEEVAPHFYHPFMFLGPKGPVGSFLLWCAGLQGGRCSS